MTTEWIRGLRHNALEGDGPCQGCPAVSDGRSCSVNPGLFNPEGEVMLVTIEPSHNFDWDQYDGWDDYNRTFSSKFLEEWTGGPILAELVEPISGVDMNDVWMTDAIKCPPEGGIDNQTRNTEFDHCKAYLRDEIDRVDPSVIIGLGNNACLRTLSALGVERQTISTAKECGRTYDTDPPVIISPHWSYGWLSRETNKSWGDGWGANQHHLEESYSRNMDAVRTSIRAVL